MVAAASSAQDRFDAHSSPVLAPLMALLVEVLACIVRPKNATQKPLLLLSRCSPNYLQSKSIFERVLIPWPQYKLEFVQSGYSTCLT